MNPLSEYIWTSYLWIAKAWDAIISSTFSSQLEHLEQKFLNFKLLYLILDNIAEIIITILKEAYLLLWTLTNLDTLGDVLVSLLKIISILLFFFFLILLAREIFKKENGLVIMPFEVDSEGNDGEKLNGRTVSDLLIKELQRIHDIHDKKPDSDIQSLEMIGLSLPPIQAQNQTSATILGQIGTIGAGGASLPLGQFILAFKQLCPGIRQNQTIYGSLQNYGRYITITARLEGHSLHTWNVYEKIMKDNSEINISCLVRELSYKIVHDLAKNNKDYLIKTSFGFKHFTEALVFYQKYKLTGNLSKLNFSRDYCFKAFNSELGHDNAKAFLVDIGFAYINEDLYDEAEKIFRYPKILEPDLAAFYTGFVHWKEGDKNEAIKDYDRALQANPKLAEAWSNRAVALMEIGKLKDSGEAMDYFTKALGDCIEALNINPIFALALNNKATALLYIGRLIGGKESIDYFNKAIVDCKAALKIDPNLALALNNKATAFLYIGNLKGGEEAMDCFKKAIHDYDQALEKDPAQSEALFNSGAAHFELGKLNANKKAKDHFEIAIEFYDRSLQTTKSEFIKSAALNGKSNALSELAKLKDRNT